MGRTNSTRVRPRQAPIVESTPLRKPQHEEADYQGNEYFARPPFVQDDQAMDQEDAGSVPTASAVRAYDGPRGYSYFSLPLHRAPTSDSELKSKEFVIPRTPAEIAAATEAAEYARHEMQQDDYEDDKLLTESESGGDENFSDESYHAENLDDEAKSINSQEDINGGGNRKVASRRRNANKAKARGSAKIRGLHW